MSHQLSSVSSYVVDLKRVKKSGGSVIQGIVQENQPLTEPKDPKGASLRRSYERPTTTCSSQKYDRCFYFSSSSDLMLHFLMLFIRTISLMAAKVKYIRVSKVIK